MLSLVPLSGGVDSVYVFTKLLRETEDDVIALHIRMGNREGRWQAEDIAARAVADHCRRTIRSFDWIETTVDRRRLASFGLDVIAVAFQVGLVHRHYREQLGKSVDRYLFGYCLEELADDEARPGQESRVKRLRDVRGIASGDLDMPRFDTLQIVSKAEELSYLGPEIARLCWTCREPVRRAGGGFNECGVCKTCKVMKKARQEAAGMKVAGAVEIDASS